MMCTTTEPRSSSTHSPDCAPSTPSTGAPSSLSFSSTWRASALVWRAESALAMIMQSVMEVRCDTSSTVMSRALMSSSAATTACFIASTCMELLCVKPVSLNIIENRVGKQITRADAGAQAHADVRGGNVQRGDHLGQDGAVGGFVQRAGIGLQPLRELLPQLVRHAFGPAGLREAGPVRDHDVGQAEQFLPAVPGSQPEKGVRP